jgi:hypothetical protein
MTSEEPLLQSSWFSQNNNHQEVPAGAASSATAASEAAASIITQQPQLQPLKNKTVCELTTSPVVNKMLRHSSLDGAGHDYYSLWFNNWAAIIG